MSTSIEYFKGSDGNINKITARRLNATVSMVYETPNKFKIVGKDRDLLALLSAIMSATSNFANPLSVLEEVSEVSNITKINDTEASLVKHLLTGSPIHIDNAEINNADVTLYTVPASKILWVLNIDASNWTNGAAGEAAVYVEYPATGGGGIFGKQTKGSNSNQMQEDYLYGVKFNSEDKNGTGLKITAYVKNNSGAAVNARCGIFRDDTGELVANGQTNDIAIANGFEGWADFTFPIAPVIAVNTDYSLAIWADGKIFVYQDNIAPGGWQAYPDFALGAFPAGAYTGYFNFNYAFEQTSLYISLIGAGGNIAIINCDVAGSSVGMHVNASYQGFMLTGGLEIHAVADGQSHIKPVLIGRLI